MLRYEYTVLTKPLHRMELTHLNKMGNDGWKIIGDFSPDEYLLRRVSPKTMILKCAKCAIYHLQHKGEK